MPSKFATFLYVATPTANASIQVTSYKRDSPAYEYVWEHSNIQTHSNKICTFKLAHADDESNSPKQ